MAGVDVLLRVMRQKEHCEFRLAASLAYGDDGCEPAAAAADKPGAVVVRVPGGSGLVGEIRLFETVQAAPRRVAVLSFCRGAAAVGGGH